MTKLYSINLVSRDNWHISKREVPCYKISILFLQSHAAKTMLRISRSFWYVSDCRKKTRSVYWCLVGGGIINNQLAIRHESFLVGRQLHAAALVSQFDSVCFTNSDRALMFADNIEAVHRYLFHTSWLGNVVLPLGI